MFAALLGSCGTGSGEQETGLIRDCPEEKIINRMPVAGESSEAGAYFIYKGERHELEEFDLDWIEANCDVTETEVY